jgi:hypothetical protein
MVNTVLTTFRQMAQGNLPHGGGQGPMVPVLGDCPYACRRRNDNAEQAQPAPERCSAQTLVAVKQPTLIPPTADGKRWRMITARRIEALLSLADALGEIRWTKILIR